MTLTSYSTTSKVTTTPKGRRYVSPAISLHRPARRELNKDEVLNFTLQTDPKNKDSTTYELTIGYFSKGTAEELLLFLRSVKKILKGQDITTGPAQYALMRRLLQGDALAAFNKAAKENATETTANYEECVRALITHILPRKALATQKRYILRKTIRKIGLSQRPVNRAAKTEPSPLREAPRQTKESVKPPPCGVNTTKRIRITQANAKSW